MTIADTRRDDSIIGMAERLLADAPSRFALPGASMGGYVSLEVVRLAPERVRGLALIRTSAVPDTPEQTRSHQTIPVSDAREAAAGIPTAELTVVEGAGHMATRENTTQVRAALAAVVARAQSAG